MMEARYFVLEKALIVEQELSLLIKSMFRIYNRETKTLDSKSSNLSYKSKVDLLYDMNELNPIEYNQFIALGEIRNKFVHVKEVDSFDKLPKNNINYLFKEFPCEIDQEENLKLRSGFNKLQSNVLVKLEMLKVEYNAGRSVDFEKYRAHKLFKQIDEILENTRKSFESCQKNNDFGLIENVESKNDIQIFIEMLKTQFNSESIKISLELPAEEYVRKVHSRKREIFNNPK